MKGWARNGAIVIVLKVSAEGLSRVSEMGRGQENELDTQYSCDADVFTSECEVVMMTKEMTELGNTGEEASLEGKVIIFVLITLSLKCSRNTQKEKTIRSYIYR